MPEEVTTAEATQAATPASTSPQAGTTTSSETQAATGTTPTQQRSAEDYERMLADLRRENASHRTKLKKFEEDEAKRNESQLTEQQKLEAKLAKLQSDHDNATRTLQERTVNYEVRLQAATMGIVDPDAAAKLLDWTELAYDDNGAPTNVEALLKALLKAKPYLASKAAQPTSGGATNPSRAQTGANVAWTAETMRPYLNGQSKFSDLSPEQQDAFRRAYDGGRIYRR